MRDKLHHKSAEETILVSWFEYTASHSTKYLKVMLASGGRFPKMSEGFGLLQNKKAASTRRAIMHRIASWQNVLRWIAEGNRRIAAEGFASGPDECRERDH